MANNVKDILKDIVGEPLSEHNLIYDSASETLEPVYFFMLDLMNDQGLNPKKLIDNFSSSPGSGYFSEMGQRKSLMQQQGQNALAQINTILRSVLNLVYDLRDFKSRLQVYDDFHSDSEHVKEGAHLALKQLWMDKVDMQQKGQGSIHAMSSGQLAFVTLRDSFLAAKTVEDVDKLDLNDRVKRVLKPRLHEFNIWLGQSEKELRKRYSIEKNYLKSQVNSLKLYSRWAKPYLIAAQKLESGDSNSPALVNAFNTMVLELTLMGKQKLNVKRTADSGDFPKDFSKLKIKRDYYSITLIDFVFRAIPQKMGGQQGNFVFGGRAEVNFLSYALNEDELKKFEQKFADSDMEDVFQLIEGATEESLTQLKEEIDEFLDEKEEEKKKKVGNNPFSALFGRYNKKEKEEDKKEKTEEKIDKIKKETWIEKNYFRKFVENTSKQKAFLLFNIYKKAHGMVNYEVD